MFIWASRIQMCGVLQSFCPWAMSHLDPHVICQLITYILDRTSIAFFLLLDVEVSSTWYIQLTSRWRVTPFLWKSAARWAGKSISSPRPALWWGWEAVRWCGDYGDPWIKHLKHSQDHRFSLHPEHFGCVQGVSSLVYPSLRNCLKLINIENRCSKRSLRVDST